jgi:hypothetical protein
MKKSLKPLFVSLILFYFIAIDYTCLAQEPPHPPPPPSEKGTATNHGPAGAPVDPGTGILLMLAAGYGLRKVYNVRKSTAK